MSINFKSPRSYKFETVQHRAGQSRQYADAYYEWTIKSNQPIATVETFCKTFLKSASYKDEIRNHYEAEIVEFKKIDGPEWDSNQSDDIMQEYRYIVKLPFTD